MLRNDEIGLKVDKEAGREAVALEVTRRTKLPHVLMLAPELFSNKLSDTVNVEI